MGGEAVIAMTYTARTGFHPFGFIQTLSPRLGRVSVNLSSLATIANTDDIGAGNVVLPRQSRNRLSAL